MRRADDPQRQEKTVQAILDAVIIRGIHGVIHRKIATIAGVSLGSMAYHFSGTDKLLMEASGRFTDRMTLQYQDFFADIKDASQTCHAITDVTYSSQVTTPDSMGLMYQLYAFVNHKPTLKMVMQNWMLRSQQTLEQWFDPATAWALNAFIEGMTPHLAADEKPLQRENILSMVECIAGILVIVSCVQRLR